MRWCRLPGYSTVSTGITSVRLASILKLYRFCQSIQSFYVNIRSKLNQPLCPKCRKKIIGRATDMENFLKVDFQIIQIFRLLSLTLL